MSQAISYRNRNTGDIQSFLEPNSRLEALNNWERVDDHQLSHAEAVAFDRAAKEKASIQAAAAIRLDSAAGAAIAQVAQSQARNGEQVSTVEPLPTLAHYQEPNEQNSMVGLLDKDDPARRVASTSFEENKRRADEEAENPPTDGVLARAKRDHKTGATQIGDNPEEHAGPAANAAATGGDVPTATDVVTGRPANDADKAAWVAWAVRQGADEAEANGKTRQALIAEYGQQ